jgi:hypothetical protein
MIANGGAQRARQQLLNAQSRLEQLPPGHGG